MKNAHKGVFHLCSHQGSNLDLRYRKPKFYPLNYESVCTEYIKIQKFPVSGGKVTLPKILLEVETLKVIQYLQHTPQGVGE